MCKPGRCSAPSQPWLRGAAWFLLPATAPPNPSCRPPPRPLLAADDFDGQLYNATNLALKGVAAIASFGYIADMYTGNSSAVTQYYVLAAEYAATMVQYSWNKDHFMIGYTGSQGDGGDPDSWPMLYKCVPATRSLAPARPL